MISKDKVSVVVPVYNVEKYLKRCFDSIVKQEYEGIEILLIDDGSTDKSGSMCDELAQTDNRCKVLHQQNKGLSGARNKGLDAASGEFIYFMDSDDYIESNLLNHLIKLMKENELDCIGFAGEIHAVSANSHLVFQMNPALYGKVMDGGDIISQYVPLSTVPFYIYRTQFLREHNIRFEEGIYYEDMLFTPEVFLKNPKIMVVDESYYHYDKRDGSITTSKISAQKYNNICYIIDVLLLKLDNASLHKKGVQNILKTYLLVTEELYKNVILEEKDMATKRREKMLMACRSAKGNIGWKAYLVCRFIRQIYWIREIGRKLK